MLKLQGNWIYEVGLRIEHQNIETESKKDTLHTPISASISALYNLDDASSVSLSFTHSQRAPDVQELFSEGVHFATRSYEQGNANLNKETSNNLELGYRADYSWGRGSINLFHNWNKDYIAQIRTGGFYNLDTELFQVTDCTECLPVFQTQQIDAHFYGFESELTLPVIESGYGQMELTLFGDYVRGKLKNGDVPRMPPLRYGLQLSYKALGHWFANIRMTCAEAQKHSGDNETNTDAYLRLDATINYTINISPQTDGMVFAKLSNLLDEEIRNSTSFLRNFSPEQGRGAELGIRLNF